MFEIFQIVDQFKNNSLDAAFLHLDEVDFYGQFDNSKLSYYNESIRNVDKILEYVLNNEYHTFNR